MQRLGNSDFLFVYSFQIKSSQTNLPLSTEYYVVYTVIQSASNHFSIAVVQIYCNTI